MSTNKDQPKNKKNKKASEGKSRRRRNIPRWDKLDNTAHLFPVIAGESMTNTYRIAVELKEEVRGELLQEALDIVLPKFDLFNVRLRTGFFWYYFEENGKKAPVVREENTYPCRYILPNKNRAYLFRVTYYKRRINLEVFHVLTDGMGGINFLKELTYQYLRLAHPQLLGREGDALRADTSLNREDSFLRNYRKSAKKGYQSTKAYQIKGELLDKEELGIIHGYVNIPALKQVCHSYGMSINEYLVAVYVWSIYKECLHGMTDEHAIRAAVPVNLRPFFDSVTTKNFFVMVSAELRPDQENLNLEQVMERVKESLRSQMDKEHLEALFSYNVSNQQNLFARAVPLFLKNIAIRLVYTQSALANSTTMTNIGNIRLEPEYEPYVEMFHAFLAMSKGQLLKATVCSYRDTLAVTFSSMLAQAHVQRAFFRQLAADGLEVTIESNGVYV
jgi:NRPS condensation-like uncharacterized protein